MTLKAEKIIAKEPFLSSIRTNGNSQFQDLSKVGRVIRPPHALRVLLPVGLDYCHRQSAITPRRKYKTPLARKLPSLARSLRHFWRHLLVLSDGSVAPRSVIHPSSLFFFFLHRFLQACLPSLLPSPVCFLLTLYLERASEGAR